MHMPILNGLKESGKGGPSEQDLLELIAQTGSLLAVFKNVSMGESDEAKHARDIIRGAVALLKKIVRDFDEPSGIGRVTVVPEETP